MGKNIRKASEKDLCRIAEIEVFNYRMNFYPIFGNDFARAAYRSGAFGVLAEKL